MTRTQKGVTKSVRLPIQELVMDHSDRVFYLASVAATVVAQTSVFSANWKHTATLISTFVAALKTYATHRLCFQMRQGRSLLLPLLLPLLQCLSLSRPPSNRPSLFLPPLPLCLMVQLKVCSGTLYCVTYTHTHTHTYPHPHIHTHTPCSHKVFPACQSARIG